MDFSKIEYKTNYLNQVIIRIDFLEFLNTTDIFCSDIEKTILRYFPRRGMSQAVYHNSLNFVINEEGLRNQIGNRIEGIQKEYYTNDGANKIILSNNFFIAEINRYQSFSAHIGEIKYIIESIFNNNHVTAQRVGTRFINIFDTRRIKIQKNYFAPEVSSILSFGEYKEKNNYYGLDITRAMNLVEYRALSMRLNFRYGVYNPSYPNKLIRNDFVLDYDCINEEPIDRYENIIQALNLEHEHIQQLFEKSITDNLRKVLNNE